MAIEFTCPQCDHLLRTADEKAGLSAKCPACGDAIWVPYPHEAHGRSVPDSGELEDALEEPEDRFDLEQDVPDDSPYEDAPSPEPPPVPLDGAESDETPVEADADELVLDAVPVEESMPRRREAPRDEVSCPNCHASNDPGATHCRICGESLEDAETVAPDGAALPKFDVNEIMSTTWRIYTDRLGLLIGAMLLGGLCVLIGMFVMGIPVVIAAVALQDAAAFVVIPALAVLFPLLIVIGTAFQVGTTRLYLNAAQGTSPSVSDIFYGFGDGRRFILRAIVLSLAMYAAVLAGFILCIFPAFLVGMVVWPAFPILLHRDPEGTDAVGMTIEFIKRDFGPVITVGAIVFGISMAAGMIPYLGAVLQLFAVPFTQLLTFVAYCRMTEQRTAID